MPGIPAEFEDLLTPRGRRILSGADPACGALADPAATYLALTNVVKPRAAESLRRVLDERLWPHLSRLDTPIPDASIRRQRRNYGELLPKTARVWTAELERRSEESFRAARAAGLVRVLRSDSLRAFAEQLVGRPLKKRNGIQVLAYGTGDYAGPHNDHHPEEPDAKDGYLDLHLSLANRHVAHQWLVGAQDGHFSRISSVATNGGLTVYRLPFWHHVTPLAATPGHAVDARRWLLLATYLFRK